MFIASLFIIAKTCKQAAQVNGKKIVVYPCNGIMFIDKKEMRY